MSITYPPEMLPCAEPDDNAGVMVCSNTECCLKAENERLRAALTRIASFYCAEAGDDANTCAAIAKSALAATPQL